MKIDIGNYPSLRSKKERKIKIQIDDWDTYSGDYTLAMIIHPFLVKFKKTKQSIPNFCFTKEYNKLTTSKKYWAEKGKGPLHKKADKLFKEAEAKWNASLDEMIWAFNELLVHNDGFSKFMSGKTDIKWVDVPGKPGFKEMTRGPKDTSKFDKKGYAAYVQRRQKAFELFGKHFQDLWS